MDSKKPDLNYFYGDGEHKPTNWSKKEWLGRGAFGNVYRIAKKVSGVVSYLAVKQIDLCIHSDKSRLEESLQRETDVLKQTSYKRIIQFHGTCSTGNYFYIFLELMPGGSLSDFIDKKGIIEENTAGLISMQILEGVAYLHSAGLFHRDIKSANVLMVDEKTIKLADFGLSRKCAQISQSFSTTVGTLRFMAPEMFKTNRYNKEVDVWGAGCVALHMLTGKIPFPMLKEYQQIVYRLCQNNPSPASDHMDELPAKSIGFFKKVFEADPAKRPSAEELLQDTFISEESYFKRELRKTKRHAKCFSHQNQAIVDETLGEIADIFKRLQSIKESPWNQFNLKVPSLLLRTDRLLNRLSENDNKRGILQDLIGEVLLLKKELSEARPRRIPLSTKYGSLKVNAI